MQHARASQLAQRFGVCGCFGPRFSNPPSAFARIGSPSRGRPISFSIRPRITRENASWRAAFAGGSRSRSETAAAACAIAVLTLVQSKQHVGTLRAHPEQTRWPVGEICGIDRAQRLDCAVHPGHRFAITLLQRQRSADIPRDIGRAPVPLADEQTMRLIGIAVQRVPLRRAVPGNSA